MEWARRRINVAPSRPPTTCSCSRPVHRAPHRGSGRSQRWTATSRLHLEGEQVGRQAGGRYGQRRTVARMLLLVAEPAGAAHDAARWHADRGGTWRTGSGGTPESRASTRGPYEWLRADFADDSVAARPRVGTARWTATATLVQLSSMDGETPISGAVAPGGELRLPGACPRGRRSCGTTVRSPSSTAAAARPSSSTSSRRRSGTSHSPRTGPGP